MAQHTIPDYGRLREFWRWFAETVAQIEDVFEDRGFKDDLDLRVQALGIYSWEIGPGLRAAGNRSLVLSPGGERKLMKLTSAMVDIAPDLEGWEFYSSKPPKAWDMRFTLKTEEGQEIDIDARGWSFYVVKQERGFEITIRAPNIEGLPLLVQQTAVEVLIEGEIGEAARIEYVDSIVIVSEFDKATQGEPIRVLKDRLRR